MDDMGMGGGGGGAKRPRQADEDGLEEAISQIVAVIDDQNKMLGPQVRFYSSRAGYFLLFFIKIIILQITVLNFLVVFPTETPGEKLLSFYQIPLLMNC